MLAIHLPTKYSRTKWENYWVIYASFGLFEYFAFNFANLLIIYWLIKCFFLIWLMLSNQAISSFQKLVTQYWRVGSFLLLLLMIVFKLLCRLGW